MKMRVATMRPCLFVLAITTGCGGAGGGPADDGGTDAEADQGAASCSSEATPVCLEPIADLPANDPLCPNPEPTTPDRLDEALVAAGLDRCTAVFTAAEWAVHPTSTTDDAFRLPHFATLHDAPLRAPDWAQQTASGLDTATLPVASAIHLAADRLGHGDAQVCTAATVSTCLHDALASLRLAFDLGAAVDDIATALASVPADLALALAPIVQAIEEAALARDAALGSDAMRAASLYSLATTITLAHSTGAYLDVTVPANRTLLSGGLDYAMLDAAATRLAATVENADLSRFAGTMGFNVEIPTPLGTMGIFDAAPHTHTPADPETGYVLLVDTGGDDVYRIAAGATVGADSRVAVAIDLGGADQYGYPEVADAGDAGRLVSDSWGRYPFSGCNDECSVSMQERQGAARLGIGLLFDLGSSDDTYTSLRMSQGFGAMGVGVLYDEGGDDTYRVEAGGQGSAQFGIGLLLDQGGADRYESYQLAQGFGFAQGFGALRDAGGDNDVYFCDPADPAVGGDSLYNVPRLPSEGNLSYCQGAAKGLGFQGTCAGCMSGGIGVLRDGGGDDQYTASVFGQASATWFGTGILDDEAGNDSYRGLWTVQGSAEDFGLALFRDGGGDDEYNVAFPVRESALGAAHGFSVAIHRDLGGADSYEAPALSLGGANDNSHGYGINVGGNDSYDAPSDRALGNANDAVCPTATCPPIPKNVGVFVDVGGTDSYTVAGADDTSWVADPDADATYTAGLDQATGDAALPP